MLKISQEELKKCRKVAEVFRDLFEICGDTIIADAGEYGIVQLHSFYVDHFDCFELFTESETMFQSFWEYWLHDRLLFMMRGTVAAELSYEEMYELLSPECRHTFEKQKVELWEQAFA